MLRTMPSAFYSDSNIGHFGLGSVGYCHFTSPIRRYPDILAHRAICSIIEKNGGPPSYSAPPSMEEISDMMEHVNDMSEDAEDWEREMIDVALATRSLMDVDFRNRTHGSIVRSITPSTIYAGLDDGVTEGRIPIRALSPLRLHIDDEETCVIASIEGNEKHDPEDPLIGKLRRNEGQDIIVLRIGDRKRCSIHSISLAQGRIDISFPDHL
jgi:ribonuclease R